MAKTVLIPGKEKRVHTGHPWVFRSDIARVEGECLPGDIVDIVSSKGRFLANKQSNSILVTLNGLERLLIIKLPNPTNKPNKPLPIIQNIQMPYPENKSINR